MRVRSVLRRVAPSRARLALARVLCSVPAGRVTRVVLRDRVRHHGLIFDTHDEAFVPSVVAAMVWGVHESDEARMIRRHLAGHSTVVELGASLGVTGAHALSVMRRDGRYLGVEANPALIDVLRSTLDDHRAGRSVEVVNAAISDGSSASVSLVVGARPQNSHLASEPGGSGTTVDVPAAVLAKLLADHGVDGDYALISDIEGAERFFLFDEASGLGRCTTLVIELHDNERADVETMVGHLVDAWGFRVLERRGVVLALAR